MRVIFHMFYLSIFLTRPRSRRSRAAVLRAFGLDLDLASRDHPPSLPAVPRVASRAPPRRATHFSSSADDPRLATHANAGSPIIQNSPNTATPPHRAAPLACRIDGIVSTYVAAHCERGMTCFAISLSMLLETCARGVTSTGRDRVRRPRALERICPELKRARERHTRPPSSEARVRGERRVNVTRLRKYEKVSSSTNDETSVCLLQGTREAPRFGAEPPPGTPRTGTRATSRHEDGRAPAAS